MAPTHLSPCFPSHLGDCVGVDGSLLPPVRISLHFYPTKRPGSLFHVLLLLFILIPKTDPLPLVEEVYHYSSADAVLVRNISGRLLFPQPVLQRTRNKTESDLHFFGDILRNDSPSFVHDVLQ